MHVNAKARAIRGAGLARLGSLALALMLGGVLSLEFGAHRSSVRLDGLRLFP